MTTADRHAAFVALLAQPDPFDLPTRRHVWTQLGEANRHATRLPAILSAWCQRLLLERVPEDVPGPAKRARRRRKKPIAIARVA